MRNEIGELIFGGAYTWSGLFSEFYGIFIFLTYLLKEVLQKIIFKPKINMGILPRLVLNYKGWYMIVKLKTKKKETDIN